MKEYKNNGKGIALSIFDALETKREALENQDEPGEYNQVGRIINPYIDTGDKKKISNLLLELKEEDKLRKVRALGAIGMQRDKQTTPYILDIIDRHDDEDVLTTAVWALGNIQDKKSIPHLTEIAVNEKDKTIRGMAVWALGMMDDESTVPILTKILFQDPSPKVRKKAISALDIVLEEPTFEYVKKELKTIDPQYKINVIRTLSLLDDERVNGLLRYMVLNDKERTVRRIAVKSIIRRRDIKTIEAILENTKNKHPQIRKNTIEIFEVLNDEWANMLIELLKGKDRAVHLQSLTKVLDPDAVIDVIKDTKSKDPETKEKAVNVFKTMINQVLIDLLTECLTDEDKGVRLKCLDVLEKIGNRHAIGSLFRVSNNDPEISVRRKAAAVVNSIADKENHRS